MTAEKDRSDLRAELASLLAASERNGRGGVWVHDTYLRTLLATANHVSRSAPTSDGMANDCTHGSATGIDTTPLSDPAKVWRCDHCGLRWREDGGPILPPGEEGR